jgi:hypothetical protein
MNDELQNALQDDDASETVLDVKAIEADIATGAKAYQKLLNHVADDWNSWSAVILGLRGLRDLAFAKSGTSDIRSWHYRQALAGLMQLKKYAIYDQIGKQTRSSRYKLMDRLDEIDVWYASLSADEKMRWKHPDAIVKHAPKHLVAGAMKGDNKPPAAPAKDKKKPAVSAESERLRALLIEVIKRLAKYEPEAMALLDQVMPADEARAFNDDLEDIGSAHNG